MSKATDECVGVVGLGYVGLPLAVAFGQHGHVVGFDVSTQRVADLAAGVDATHEADPELLAQADLAFTTDPDDLKACTALIVAVPTPVDKAKHPDLTALRKATEAVGQILQRNMLVVYESTVYPGVTETVCLPILEQLSGLQLGDFGLGYSPERINPGDKKHTLANVIKIVSGHDDKTLARVAALYRQIVDAGVHEAPNIKTAEAAKVIENIQRDLNIALINELAIIFGKLGIDTMDVLEAAGTKWNFLNFRPGLVGGHCIGVDPYYLTYKAEEIGYHPEVILSGRRINDGMGRFIVTRVVRMLIQSDVCVKNSKVGVLGLTFKEDCPDLRNTRVIDIIHELHEYGIQVLVHDPLADSSEAKKYYDVELKSYDDFNGLKVMIVAVGHSEYKQMNLDKLLAGLDKDGCVIDVKASLDPQEVRKLGFSYWRL